jgi:GAF domain-containing protein
MAADDARSQLLTEAAQTLAVSRDEYSIYFALANLVVPRLADDCVVFQIDASGNVHRISEASISEEHVRRLRAMRENPPSGGASNSVMSAVRGGKSVIVDDVDDRKLANLAGSTELAESLRAVHPRTFVCVPIFAYGNVVGAFTFGVSTTARKYTQDDVELAEELAHHAGAAIEAAYR